MAAVAAVVLVKAGKDPASACYTAYKLTETAEIGQRTYTLAQMLAVYLILRWLYSVRERFCKSEVSVEARGEKERTRRCAPSSSFLAICPTMSE
jgi:hypothetical protein